MSRQKQLPINLNKVDISDESEMEIMADFVREGRVVDLAMDMEGLIKYWLIGIAMKSQPDLH
jgi:hypothetical protein